MTKSQKGPTKKIKVESFAKNFNLRFFKILDMATDKKHEAKDLVFTKKIRSLFELVIDKSRLKQRNVQLITLNDHSIRNYNDTSESCLIFLISPSKRNLRLTSLFLKAMRRKGIRKSNRSLILFPKRDILSQILLRQERLHEHFGRSIYDFNVNLVPLDSDLVSLEDDDSMKDLYVTKEFGCFNKIADWIVKLQTIYGKNRSFFGKGDDAFEVAKIADRGLKDKAIQERLKKSKEPKTNFN